MPETAIQPIPPVHPQPLNRILYVEDEPDIQTVVRIPLQIAGYEMEVCGSGEEALKKAPAFEPDLILLDVMMPGMDGPTTLLELRKIPKFEKVPVVFITAKTQKQEIEQFKRLGALDVITKPFNPMSLAETVKSIWEENLKIPAPIAVGTSGL